MLRAGVALLLVGIGCLFACNNPSVQTTDSGMIPAPDAGDTMPCEMPRQKCGDTCTNVASDPFNCGQCGSPCPSDTFCGGGMCSRVCSGGLMACGMSCVDPSTDHDNCGGCNSPCAADRQCKGGSCHCPDMTTECMGACINTDQDRMNCGICARQCNADQICNRGTCVCAGGTKESSCNDGMDNNCNNLIDCADPDCVSATRKCMGACGMGIETCGMNGQWSACMGGDGSPDVCGSGIDSNCDGRTTRSPDQYEPNDDCDHAFMLPDTDPNSEMFPSFDSVEDSNDYFSFTVTDSISYPEAILVTLDQISMGHDYDVYLFASLADCKAGTPLAQSTSPGNQMESINWTENFANDDSGTYYVRVARVAGYSCTSTYHLVINGLR